MEKQKFLSEEKFQHTNKKVKKVALAIFLTGLAISIGLVIFGTVEKSQARKEFDQKIQTQKAEYERKSEEAKKRLPEIESEIDELKIQEQVKFSECVSLIHKVSAEEEARCDLEKEKIVEKIFSLESEKSDLGKYKKPFVARETFNEITPIQYMIAFQVILISSALAGGVFMMSKRREMGAYAAQQGMPVAQEMIEKMTPTAAKSSGVVAESVAEGLVKGYHKGMKEEEKKDEKKSENQE